LWHTNITPWQVCDWRGHLLQHTHDCSTPVSVAHLFYFPQLQGNQSTASYTLALNHKQIW
jgi:hypothetical protein